jgi:biotin carboxyl carrier protein
MPGSIVSISVSEGAAVKKGQTLLILEAMKMENEIISPRDGVVASVIVAKGASVNSGDPLVAIS